MYAFFGGTIVSLIFGGIRAFILTATALLFLRYPAITAIAYAALVLVTGVSTLLSKFF